MTSESAALPEPLLKQVLRLKGTPADDVAKLPGISPVLAAFAAVTWDSTRKYVIGTAAIELQWESVPLSERIIPNDSAPLLRLATDAEKYRCVVRADDTTDDPVVYTVTPNAPGTLHGGRPLSRFLSSMKTVASVAAPKAQLLEAMRDGDEALAITLLKNGPVPTELDKSGLTPLHYAALARLPDVVEALLAAGADANAPLRTEMKLTKKFTNEAWSGGRSLSTGETPLLSALCDQPRRRSDEEADLKIVRALLKSGADVNKADALHRTPLVLAAGNRLGRFDAITAELLAAGANPNVTADSSPLSAAISSCSTGAQERVRALLAAGANPNLVIANAQIHGVKGPTAIHAAAIWGFDDLLTVLLESGGDPNAKAADGTTPLASAHARTKPILIARGEHA